MDYFCIKMPKFAFLALLSVCCLQIVANAASGRGLNEEFTWTRINYSVKDGRNTTETIYFPGRTNGVRKNERTANNDDEYIYENNIPMGANLWKDKLFITVPRRRLGVPSTLNYVPLNSTNRHNVPLIPYPNYETNKFGTPRRNGQILFTSVYRVAVDKCDRLWFVDTGIVEIPDNQTQIQPTSLVIIDLNTDQILRRHEFPSENLRPNSNLAIVTVDITSQSCNNDAYAYIPDVGGYGLIVYSLKNDRSWRVNHNYFYLESLRGEFFIGGLNFQWNDGIFSIALSEIERDGYRTAYFHAMAGTHIFSVSTRILRDRELATRSYHGDDFKILGDRGNNSQTSASDLHEETGVLFLALVNQNALGCWNTNKNFHPSNFATIHRNDEKMIYPSDVKVRENQVIMLTNTMPVFLYSSLNYDVTNFRVWMGNVGDVIRNTPCDYRKMALATPPVKTQSSSSSHSSTSTSSGSSSSSHTYS